MANRKHLAKIKEGLAAWSSWRQANPDIQPDINEGNLVMAELSQMDLRWADPSMTDLRGADLRGADLTGAELYGANLSGANLSEANLCVWPISASQT